MKHHSFGEMTARERARALMDAGTFRELVDPFARLESPHLPKQGIVPQSDDGVVIARGKIRGKNALVLSLEGGFQGGSVGEVNGAKIAGALELALKEARAGTVHFPVLLFDTGGIRLQEANLGLLAISEIHSAIVELREFVPVMGVIAGRVGCFGGMAIAAALCSFLIGTEIGRLGLNGPEVIEQEAGTAEFDPRDRVLIWQTLGCRRRFELSQIDRLVDDSVEAVVSAVGEEMSIGAGRSKQGDIPRTRDIARQLEKVREHTVPNRMIDRINAVPQPGVLSRGLRWFDALVGNSASLAKGKSVLVGDMRVGEEAVRAISVVPNPDARFPRARQGQVGLEEGWDIAKAIWDAIESDEGKIRRALLAIVDVPGQAFGFNEEVLGIHLSLAAATDAYIAARQLGHPVIAFIVGSAISGAFLAHGLQSSEILALDHETIEIHVMSEASVARVTRRSPEQVAALARIVPSTARNVRSFVGLGGVDRLLPVNSPGLPDAQSVENARGEIRQAIQRVRAFPKDPRARLNLPSADASRRLSRRVRQEIESQWVVTAL
jgi:malonate decarboxylase beta subunit